MKEVKSREGVERETWQERRGSVGEGGEVEGLKRKRGISGRKRFLSTEPTSVSCFPAPLLKPRNLLLLYFIFD